MRLFIAALALVAAGCTSQSTVRSHPVTDTGGADARRRAEVHTALAGEYYSRGNYAVALSEAQRAVAEDATYAPAHNMQGLVLMELREDGPAREAFDRALSLSPNNPEVAGSCACATRPRAAWS
jgi:type IV pilus assembly protein PilF